MAQTWTELLTRQHGVFTTTQAAEHGITSATIVQRRRDGYYRTVWPRTHYAGPVGELPYPATLWSAVLCLTDAVLSHQSAARLWRLEIPAGDGRGREGNGMGHGGDGIHVTVDLSDWRPRSGLVVHRKQRLRSADRTAHRGLPVTTLERTLVDTFPLLDRREERRALIAEAIRRRRTTRSRLTQTILRVPQLPLRGELLRTIELAAGGSHSAGEMRLYEFMADWGFPTPARQLLPELPRGRRYLDCALPAYKMALEYDGAHHLTDTQRHDDLLRDQLLRRFGWHTFRVTELRMADERRLANDIWEDLLDQAAAVGVAPPPTPARLERLAGGSSCQSPVWI